MYSSARTIVKSLFMQNNSGLKALNIIHKALMAGQVIFAVVCIFITYLKLMEAPAKELDRTLQVVALLVAAAGVFTGSAIFKRKLQQLKDGEYTAKEKFEQYRAACIIQWALMEGPGIFCSICFLLTANYAFIALAMLLLFIFAAAAPAKMKVLLQLQISESELEEL